MESPAPFARPIRRISCIQLGGEFPDFCHRLIMPDYGMPLIGTILSKAGYETTTFMEHVRPPVWETIAQSDLVCMSTLSAGADKTYRLADRIRAEVGVPVIMGGTHASYFPKDALQHCDFVVMGEGDESILDLIETLSSGGDVGSVAGIAYNDGGVIRKTKPGMGPASFDTVPDFTLIHGYKRMSWWNMLLERKVPLLTVQASRGCHYHCTYCIVDTMFPAGYRKRSIDSVIEDLRDKRRYGRELLFVDNDFAARPKDTKDLLRRIIAEDLDFDILVLTRSEVAKQDEILDLMRKAGVSQIYQGYESVEPATLLSYDKHQTVGRIREAVDKLHDYGFRISGSFVLGADTDTLETLDATVDFVLQSKLTIAYFFPLWGHYIEQKNGNRSIVPRHRAIFRSWGYCDGNFVTHFPARMRPSQLQAALNEAHRRVFSASTVLDALRRKKYADAKEKATHRLMWSSIQTEIARYLPWLEEIEHGLYDSDNRLREDALWERYRTDPRWKFGVDDSAPAEAYESPTQRPLPVFNNIRCVPSTGIASVNG